MKTSHIAALLVVTAFLLLAATAVAGASPGAAAGVALPWAGRSSDADGPVLLSTTLAFVPDNTLVGLAGATVIQIRLDAVSGLYGYQFQVTYDAAKVSAAGAFVNSFFDTSANANIPAGWSGTCGGGVCRFAATRMSPGLAISGSGVLAQITFTGLSGGMSPLAFSGDILSDRDGFAIAHTAGAGLVTVCTGSTILQMTPAASKIAIGQSVAITIEGICLSNLYGYQIQVDDDAAKLSAAGAFANSFFDTTGASIPSAWNQVCAGGNCRFAAARVNPATALTGSGPLATITYTAQHAGVIPLTFASHLLSDRDGMPISHITAGATITVSGYATIEGIIRLQARLTPITPGTVTFTETTSTYAPISVTFSGTSGAFSATVPVDAGGMIYDVLGSHLLYLSNLRAGLAVQPEQLYTLPVTTLYAGDANNDGLVFIQDLSCIGNDFDGTPGTCGGHGGTDINADGAVNIYDLSVTGGNYECRSPQLWTSTYCQ